MYRGPDNPLSEEILTGNSDRKISARKPEKRHGPPPLPADAHAKPSSTLESLQAFQDKLNRQNALDAEAEDEVRQMIEQWGHDIDIIAEPQNTQEAIRDINARIDEEQYNAPEQQAARLRLKQEALMRKEQILDAGKIRLINNKIDRQNLKADQERRLSQNIGPLIDQALDEENYKDQVIQEAERLAAVQKEEAALRAHQEKLQADIDRDRAKREYRAQGAERGMEQAKLEATDLFRDNQKLLETIKDTLTPEQLNQIQEMIHSGKVAFKEGEMVQAKDFFERAHNLTLRADRTNQEVGKLNRQRELDARITLTNTKTPQKTTTFWGKVAAFLKS